MGSDLFGSFAESSCASLVIATQIDDLRNAGWGPLCFPLCVSALGVVVGVGASLLVERFYPVIRKESIERCLSLHIATSTAIMIPFTLVLSVLVLPETFTITGISSTSFVASNIAGNQYTPSRPTHHSF
jgi:H+-translocating diphosphatase